MIKTRTAISLLLTLGWLFSFSQVNLSQQGTYSVNTNSGRGCGTDSLPANFENWVQGLSTQGKLGGGQTQSVFNIPVIVHVVHNNEPLNSVSANSGGNLNAAQIYDQINILNRDFNGLNADTSLIPSVFKPLLGKFQFNFCLAVVNPTGGILPEPGIDRINRVSKGWNAPPYSSNYVTNTIKPNSIWDPSKYMNMWVLDLGSSLLGFATFPNPGTSTLSGLSPPYGTNTTDGVVMDNEAFGSIGTASVNTPYHLGRTTVHEIGHWLGLRHIWGDATCGNDYVADTPPASGPNYGCPNHPLNMGVCSGNSTGEMFMNFMDYSNDACMTMFTNDQKFRAQTIMIYSPLRSGLLTSTVCNTPTVTNEVGILYVSNPTYSQVLTCSNSLTPSLIVHNFGSNTVTSATYSYNVDGVGTQTFTWTGNLLPGTSGTITLGPVLIYGNGHHQLNVGVYNINNGTDPNMTNNTNNQMFVMTGQYSIAVSGPTNVCSGETIALTASSSASSYTWQPGMLSGPSITASPLSSTIYTVSANNGTCIVSRTVGITVNQTPTITINSPTICQGSSASLTASGACSYTWLPGNVTIASLTVSPLTTTQYSLIGMACNGCTASNIATVSVTSSPTVSLMVAPLGSLCPGGTATITASGATSYSWNHGATGSVVVVSPASSTSYSVTGINGGCSATGSALVPVGSNSLILSVNPPQPVVCDGQPVLLLVTGASSYTWSTGSNSSTVSVFSPTTTVLTVTGTNGSCQGSTNVTVTISSSPTVAVTAGASSVCAGSNVQLTASGASTYSWGHGATGSSITATLNVPTIFTVTGISASGCSDTGTILVGISGSTLGTVLSSTPASVCAGGSVTISASGLTSYTWAGFTSSGAQTTQVGFGANTFLLNGHNGSCPASATLTVPIQNGQPFILVGTGTTICRGQSTQFSAHGPYNDYSWLPSPATGSHVSLNPIVNTAYTVQGTGGPSGCSAYSVINIAVTPGPSVALTTSNTPCDEPCSGVVSVTPLSGTGPYTFSLTGSNCTSLPCNNLCPGLYILHTSDTTGCTDVKYFSIECFIRSGINENTLENSAIYPNPANDIVKVNTGGLFSIRVYDQLGRQVLEKKNCNHETEISVIDFAAGVYLLEVSNNDNSTYFKLIKE